MDTRLTWDEPELAAKISGAGAVVQRSLAHAVVDYAFSLSPDQSEVAEVSQAFADEDFGETSRRSWLRMAWLNAEKASDEAASRNDHPGGFAHAKHARALAAAYHAIVDDPEKAALEAVYEVYDESTKAQVDQIVNRLIHGR